MNEKCIKMIEHVVTEEVMREVLVPYGPGNGCGSGCLGYGCS